MIEPLPPGDVKIAYPLRESTVADLGALLPLGLPDQIGRTTFRFRPATVGLARRLGALRARKDLQAKPGKLIAHALGVALAEIGGQTIEATEEGAAAGALAISRLSAADVMYMCLYRLHVEGESIPIDGGPCRGCGAALGRVEVDPGTVEVTTVPAGVGTEPPRARVGLRRPLQTARGQITTLLLRPASWAQTFWDLSAQEIGNGAALEARLLAACVEATDLEGVSQLLPAWLDDVPARTARQILEVLERITPTPDMTAEVGCPACGASNQLGINWQAGLFF